MGISTDLIYDVKRKMLAKYPRFGSEIAVANIEFKENLPYHTAATDGKNVYVDPNYFESLSENERIFTIAHEIAHYILHANPSIARYPRIYPGDDVKPYEDSEWQADAFAGEFLCPCQAIRGMTPEEVADKFGVSVQAAKTQLKKSLRCFQ